MPYFDRLGNDMNESAAEQDAIDEERRAAEEDVRREATTPTAEEWDAYMEEQEVGLGVFESDDSYGDPRRCERHPEVRTSSDDGMFDAPCGRCESEGDEHCAWSAWREELAASGPTCEDIFTPWDSTRNCRTDCMQLCYPTQSYWLDLVATDIPF